MTHTIAVDRPPDLPPLPFESILVTYPDGTSAPGRAYWTASESVASAVSAIDNLPLAEVGVPGAERGGAARGRRGLIATQFRKARRPGDYSAFFFVQIGNLTLDIPI